MSLSKVCSLLRGKKEPTCKVVREDVPRRKHFCTKDTKRERLTLGFAHQDEQTLRRKREAWRHVVQDYTVDCATTYLDI